MGEFKQGKERGKIMLVGAALLVGAILCVVLVIASKTFSVAQGALIVGAIVALYYCYRQVVDYLSDPTVKVDAEGISATGYVPAGRNFSLAWADTGMAFLRAAGGSGGTLTFMAKDDPTRVLAVLHGYSRYLHLNELRDLIKEHMGVSPTFA